MPSTATNGYKPTKRPGHGASSPLDDWIDAIAPCPWSCAAGSTRRFRLPVAERRTALYTSAERRRRDESAWTIVQAVLAPLQFLAFAVSLVFVLRTLATGEGAAIATASVVVKTLFLYAIMITGAIWEKDVFGQYLFARPFFWEDVVSMLVLALHSAYLAMVFLGVGSLDFQMWLALAAYASYLVNAAQFLWKLRLARLERPAMVWAA